ncbi:hypothetical protein [Paraburkholderia sp. SIMBA_030]|uniref:hypothetical protein n=1 Tax=Paraburkholderia sp. SIMBA_030 TaxID=3085773 RepID=UPI00397DE150
MMIDYDEPAYAEIPKLLVGIRDFTRKLFAEQRRYAGWQARLSSALATICSIKTLVVM